MFKPLARFFVLLAAIAFFVTPSFAGAGVPEVDFGTSGVALAALIAVAAIIYEIVKRKRHPKA